ncbi:MAG: response regulator [Balneolaceae bacterium]
MNILIVEDNQVLTFMLQRMVERLGYQVMGMVTRGEEAVSIASTKPCDLILMDIMLLGEMDGIEAYEHIRESKTIPVIYTTGNSDPHNRQRASDLGFHDFLTKPISFQELTNSIERLKNGLNP